MNKGEFPILLVVIDGYISVLFISLIHTRKQKETTTHPFKDKWWFRFVIRKSENTLLL